jgi:hypothetical protein
MSLEKEQDESSPEHREQRQHAHIHIEPFLNLPSNSRSVQILTDGSSLTAEAIVRGVISLQVPILVQDDYTSLGMEIFSGSVRDVAKIAGRNYPIRVVDVDTQDELMGWTLQDLADYFEEHDTTTDTTATVPDSRNCPRRAHKQQQQQQVHQPSRVLNQISFEFSQTPLARMVLSPTFVRELSWIHQA